MSSAITLPQGQDDVVDINHQARREVDEEIIRLYEEIRCLRSKRNTLAPISRLPSDVLRIIFNTIGRCISLAHLEDVALKGRDHELDLVEFCQVFRIFTTVQSLKLGGVYVNFFLRSIALQNEIFAQHLSGGFVNEGGGSTTEQLVFRGLKKLKLGEGFYTIEEELDFSHLPRWLRYQKARGVELKLLSTHSLNVPVELRSELEDLVEEACWEKLTD